MPRCGYEYDVTGQAKGGSSCRLERRAMMIEGRVRIIALRCPAVAWRIRNSYFARCPIQVCFGMLWRTHDLLSEE